MPFPRRFLHDGEEIVIDRKPHLWFLARPVALVFITLVAWIGLSGVWNYPDGNFNKIVNWVTAALFVLSLLYFAVFFVKWRSTNFVITTDRLIYRTGVVAKQGKEIPLERINDLAYTQSIFERLIGAGDLLIESGGEQGQQRFTDIRHPFEVQNEIYRQMERTQARDLDRMAGRRELSVPEQLDKLDELRQRGVLSQAEFDAKKAQLLERM